jgi:hypothetical protein
VPNALIPETDLYDIKAEGMRIAIFAVLKIVKHGA